MSNDNQNQGGFFSSDWMETQRKYWEDWMAMSRKAMGLEGQSVTAPWESALDHWWKAIAPAAPQDSQKFMERMMDQGKSFFKMAENLIPGLGAAGAADGWAGYLKNLDDMQKRFTGSLEDGDTNMHRLMAFWELPYDNFQRMSSSLSLMPGDFLRNMPHETAREKVDRMLSAPGLGYTREEQSQYQDLIRRSLDYQKALQEYLAFHSRMGVKAIDRMRTYLQGVMQSGKTVDSARELYDNWVMCCEAVYGEEVSTPEYAQMHGHLVNAQMALKHRMAIIIDENLGALNMPSRSEVRTLQDRLQELRREEKRQQHELHLIQLQLAALTGHQAAATPSARPARSQGQLAAAPRSALRAGAGEDPGETTRRKAPSKPSTTN